MSNATKDLTTNQRKELAYLQERLEAWFREMIEAEPRADDGAEHGFRVAGGVGAYGDDDQALYALQVKTWKTGYT